LKAITHDLFSLGVGLFLVFRLGGRPDYLYLFLTLWLALTINEIIDVLGHFNRGGIPVRSLWTHSVFTAPIWGVVVAVASIYLVDIVTSQTITTSQTLFVAVLGATLAYSHLLLDALTEGGVYLGRRRIALAHLRYNNLALNSAFGAIGVLLALAAFV
jgi:hypothetical protein